MFRSVVSCFALPLCLIASVNAADRKLVRHPHSGLFWANGALKKGHTVEIDWNVPRNKGAKMCGVVTDITPPVAEIKITAIKRLGIGAKKVGTKMFVNVSSKICGSCKGSARTSKVASLPAKRTLTLDPRDSVMSITIPTSKKFGRSFDYDKLTMPALGKITLQIHAPDARGIARVDVADISQLPTGAFMLRGVRFTNFEKRLLGQQLWLDTRAQQNNLWGRAQVVHRFDALGKRWEMSNDAAIDGSYNLQSGQAWISAFADFSEPRIIGGPRAQYVYYGHGCPGSNRAVPVLTAQGIPAFGTRLGLRVSRAHARAPALLTFGAGRMNFDLTHVGAPGCIVATLAILALPTVTNSQGIAEVQLPVPNSPSLRGAQFNNQYFILDPANRLGLVSTRGGEGTIGSR